MQRQIKFQFLQSPSRVGRICQIQQKLTILGQSKIQNMKNDTLSNLQSKMVGFENRLFQQIKNGENTSTNAFIKVSQFKEQLIRSKDSMKQIESRCAFSGNYRQTSIKQLKKKLLEEMSIEKQERLKIEGMIIKQFQNNIERLLLTLSQEMESRKQFFNELDENFSSCLPQVNQKIQNFMRNSQQKLQSLGEQIGYEYDILKTNIKKHEEKSEEGNKKIMEFMKNVISQIKASIANQKTQRQFNKEKVMNLFQEINKNITLL